jgi:hypothetical protein
MSPDFVNRSPKTAVLALDAFLEHLETGHMSSAAGERDVRARLQRVTQQVEHDGAITTGALLELRNYFRDRDWTGLILPGGTASSDLDEFLCSRHLLRALVDAGSTERGLLLQLESPPTDQFSLTDVFPAFAAALERRTEWPGLLLWNDRREAELFPFGKDEDTVLQNLLWVLRNASRRSLRSLREEYAQVFETVRPRTVQIIQISDVRLGSEEADVRLPHLQQHLIGLTERFKQDSDVIVVATGDLMDSPDSRHLDQARAFLQFLSNLTPATLRWCYPETMTFGATGTSMRISSQPFRCRWGARHSVCDGSMNGSWAWSRSILLPAASWPLDMSASDR